MFVCAYVSRCLSVILVFIAVGMASAQASVVMNGTRVIFTGGAKERSISFSNPDSHANLVQVWVSREPGVRPEPGAVADAGVPFVLTPPIFKLEPHTGQLVRLMLLPGERAQDREELFYLNFTQIPAVREDTQDANRLMLLMRSTVKLFYRPAVLGQGPDQLARLLRYEWAGDRIRIENPTAFHVNVSDLRLQGGDEPQKLTTEAFMIAPKSSMDWSVEEEPGRSQVKKLAITTVNDYGSEVVTLVELGKK